MTMMSNNNEVVKLKRKAIAVCMTCPLCNKLFRDATTIKECLHTFCRKCVRKKLSDVACCPVCNTKLGGYPLDSLRPDHNLQYIKANIFPCKRKKMKELDNIVPSVTLPEKRKEKSLASLMLSPPRVPARSEMIRRRSKSITGKSFHGLSFPAQILVKKGEYSTEDLPENSPETLNNTTRIVRQETGNGAETREAEDDDLLKPLHCLLEVANKKTFSNFSAQGPTAKSEPLHSAEIEVCVLKTNAEGSEQKSANEDEKKGNETETVIPKNETAILETGRSKKFQRSNQKKASVCGKLNVSPQALLDRVSAIFDYRSHPLWFSLVASTNKDGDTSLPQISTSYLRIKDRNITISFIQKYLMRKLDLASEDEVEIRCMGKTLVASMSMNELVGLWLETTSEAGEKVSAIIGSSGKDFVLALSYGRKTTAN